MKLEKLPLISHIKYSSHGHINLAAISHRLRAGV